jgi:hypothetical protein
MMATVPLRMYSNSRRVRRPGRAGASTRCGLRSALPRIRPICEAYIPNSDRCSASSRWDRTVSAPGGTAVAAAITLSRSWAGPVRQWRISRRRYSRSIRISIPSCHG